MKKIIILVMALSSCAHIKNPSDRDIETYCQDLNVLYQKIDAISSNIVNVNTTRTAEGGHYKRIIVQNCKNGFCEIIKDPKPPILKYDPKHPDADKNGYVAFPNINLQQENADKLIWSKVYETVLANSPVPSNFFFKDPRADLYP
jgi:flagellar basal-body rod protein FlgC